MTDPRHIRIEDFDYALPQDSIAAHPLALREESKLLVYTKGILTEKKFSDLPELALDQYHFILNDTRVIHARLHFHKATGGVVEIFCLEPMGISMEQGLEKKHECRWKCLVGGAKKWKGREVLTAAFGKLDLQELTLSAQMEEPVHDGFIIHFRWQPGHLSFSEVLEAAGIIPLPPYFNREAEASDELRYQTVFATHEGSVAAPTAGLHFTREIIETLKSNGSRISFLTLHVGAGTFKPVTSSILGEHIMHHEYFSVHRSVIEMLILSEKKIIPVGTTSLRSLESLYWLGVKLLTGKFQSEQQFSLEQWEAYELNDHEIPKEESLISLLKYLDSRGEEFLCARTALLLAPGYRFRIAKGIITNFHLPKSTLILLIAALVGKDWRLIYDFALSNRYNFLSYGDSSLLLP
ncbi:MAG: S-adenosylmethionine:tRNA ribosyltransferase-isomerase [Flavobacteriales bacterium]|nr:S-adenosylmethionine:tRNA ribosyltransferase-isomerase [Flavobacteriales bacterium]